MPILVFLLLCSLALPAAAAGDELLHPVRSGDTLIGLAGALLADPADWTLLQRLNRVRDPRRLPVGSVLRIPRSLLRPEPRQAEVVSAAGEARVGGRAAAPGAKVGAGERLETGADGHIELRLPDGSTLLLPARSAVRVETLAAPPGTDQLGVGLKLEQGRLESEVTPRRGPAARFQVDTPSAVIGVRGTRFRLGAGPGAGGSRVEVTEGTVSVAPAGAGAGAERALAAGYGMVVRAGTALPPPLPLLPPPDTAGLPTLFERPVPRIALPELAGARAWRARVREAAPGAPVLLDRYLEEGPLLLPGLDDGVYRLSLRGIDEQGLEGADASHVFELRARPEPPFQQGPAAGAEAGAGVVEFRWTQAPEAARYRLQVSTGEDFGAPVLSRDGIDGLRLRAELPAGQYWWRLASVRADGRTGPWGEAARFVLWPRPATPAAPAAPAVGEAGLAFRWSGEPGQQFEYQFAADPAFAGQPLYSGRVAGPAASLPRPQAGQYWMRVRAVDRDGYLTPWSGAQGVTVADPPRPPYWLLLSLPLLLAL